MAADLTRFGLTPMQEDYARHLARHGKPEAAGEAAGYRKPSDWQRLLGHPGVSAAVRFLCRSRLQDELVPAALHAADELASSGAGPVRGAMVKTILDRGGFAPPAGVVDLAGDRQLSDLSPGELRALITQEEQALAKLSAELAERATLVNAPSNAPKPAEEAVKAPDYLD